MHRPDKDHTTCSGFGRRGCSFFGQIHRKALFGRFEPVFGVVAMLSPPTMFQATVDRSMRSFFGVMGLVDHGNHSFITRSYEKFTYNNLDVNIEVLVVDRSVVFSTKEEMLYLTSKSC